MREHHVWVTILYKYYECLCPYFRVNVLRRGNYKSQSGSVNIRRGGGQCNPPSPVGPLMDFPLQANAIAKFNILIVE